MGQKIPIKIDSPVSTSGTPETYLRQRDFDALIYRFGYNVYLDKMIPCPCKEEGVNSAKLTCKNCYGTGFILAERLQTKAFLAQMNFPTQYKDWSVENIGTAQISTLSQNPVAFMDRVVMYEEKNIYSELIYPIIDNTEIVAFCAYPPLDIQFCKMFQGEEETLLDLDISKIQIDNEGKIILTQLADILYERNNYIYSPKTAISIRYTYMPSYHVVDIMRNLITSPTDTPTNGISPKGTRVQFPYSAMCRMSHLVLERSNLLNLPDGYNSNANYESTNVLDLLKDKIVSKEFCDTEK